MKSDKRHLTKTEFVDDLDHVKKKYIKRAQKLQFKIIPMDSLEKAFDKIRNESNGREGENLIIADGFRTFWFGPQLCAEIDVGFHKNEISKDVREHIESYLAGCMENTAEFYKEKAS